MPGPSHRPSGLTDSPQVTFADEVAKATGLDPRVVYTWTVAEGAYAPGGTGGFNFLNLRPYKPNAPGGDVGVAGISSGNFDQFKDLQSAIDSSVARIKQPFLWNLLSPVLARKSTPREQIDAIATSGWDSGHYESNGVVGGKLVADFASTYGNDALASASDATPLPTSGAGLTKGQQSLHPGRALSGLTGEVFGGLTDWITANAGYALVYAALVMFSIVLAIFGLLALLGVKPKTLLAAGARAAAAAA